MIKNNIVKKNLSLVAVIVIMIVFSLIKLTESGAKQISYDNLGSYMYIPALLHYNDIGLQNFDTVTSVNNTYKLTPTYYQFTKIENGNHVIRFFIGMSYLYFPGYLAGHAWSHVSDYPSDGFSFPYQYAIWLWGFLFFLVGVFYARKILLHYFDEGIAAITLLIVFPGTNILFLALWGSDSPHLYLLTLNILLIWSTIKWHDSPSGSRAMAIGFLVGLITVTRPSELFCFLIPLLWGITGKEALNHKMQLIINHKWHIVYLVLFAIMPLIPQFVYWKTVTGNWLFFPYNDPGSQLILSDPKVLNVLFGFRKGWILYAPLTILGFIGMYMAYRRKMVFFLPLFFYLAINVYLISCFTSLVSYGLRAFIQSYALLLLPVGLVVADLMTRRMVTRILAFGVILALGLLTIFQSWQYSVRILSLNRMTGDYYKAVFLKTTVTDTDKALLLPERAESGYEVLKDKSDFFNHVICFKDFETPDQVRCGTIDSSRAFSGRYSLRLDSTDEYPSEVRAIYNQVSDRSYVYIRSSVRVFLFDSIVDKNSLSLVTLFFKNKVANKYMAKHIITNETPLKINEWNYFSFDYLSPEFFQPTDTFASYLWYRGKKDVLIDDFRVEIFEPKKSEKIDDE